MKKTDVDRLLEKNHALTQSDYQKVTSHVQRAEKGSDWIINTILIEGQTVPFRFKRKKQYKNLKGARVNLTYYPVIEIVAGIPMEAMKVIRIRVS